MVTLPSGARAVYEIGESEILRRTIDSDDQVRYQAWSLPEHRAASWQLVDESGVRLIRLTVSLAAKSAEQDEIVETIDASVRRIDNQRRRVAR